MDQDELKTMSDRVAFLERQITDYREALLQLAGRVVSLEDREAVNEKKASAE